MLCHSNIYLIPNNTELLNHLHSLHSLLFVGGKIISDWRLHLIIKCRGMTSSAIRPINIKGGFRPKRIVYSKEHSIIFIQFTIST